MSESHPDDDEGYRGPAEIVTDAGAVPVTVRLTGHFEPISGSYRWYGRVDASDALAALVGTDVVLRTPHGEVATRLADVDPWGRARVEGFGAAPFPVQTQV